MTTPNQYAVIVDKVYNVDSVKSKKPIRSYNSKSTFIDKNSGQKYKVLNTIDTNDKYNSQGYEKNGFQGMAVAPIGVDGIPDYNCMYFKLK